MRVGRARSASADLIGDDGDSGREQASVEPRAFSQDSCFGAQAIDDIRSCALHAIAANLHEIRIEKIYDFGRITTHHRIEELALECAKMIWYGQVGLHGGATRLWSDAGSSTNRLDIRDVNSC